jgi:hypothetical protein
MTKKNFIALADKIRHYGFDHTSTDFGYKTKVIAIADLVDFCQSQNPQFDRSRWLDYIKNGKNGGKQ